MAQWHTDDPRAGTSARGAVPAWETVNVRELLEAYPDAVVLVGPDRRVRFANSLAEGLFGRAPGGLSDRAIETLFTEGERSACLEHFSQFFDDDPPRMAILEEVEAQRTGGARFPTQCTLTRMVLDGEALVLGVVRDVTERKRSQEMLEESLELMGAKDELEYRRTLLESQNEAAVDGILIVDETGRVVSYNQRFIDMWGIDEDLIEVGATDEVALASALDKVADPAAFLDGIEELAEDPDARTRDEVRFTDGRVFERWSTPVVSDDGTHYGRGWYFRDITDRTRAEEELQDAYQRLKEHDRFRLQFINNVSHDLGGSLTPIKLQAHMLASAQLGELNDRQRRAVELLESAMDQFTMLVQDLKDVARLEADQFPMDPRDVALDEVVTESVEPFHETARAAGLALEVEIGPTVTVLADAQRVRQVLTNLVGNAIKFTPEGGTVTVRTHLDDDHARVEVRDTGIGLEPEQVDRLFQPFSQVHDRATIDARGTGLGLYICKGIVEAHGGRIQCQSNGPGRGTMFTVTLPLAPPGR